MDASAGTVENCSRMVVAKACLSGVTTCLGLGKMPFKGVLQFRHLDSRVAVGPFGDLHHGRLQPPQDVLHRIGGLNRRELLRQTVSMGLVQQIDVVDGRAADGKPQCTDQGRWGYHFFPHSDTFPSNVSGVAEFARIRACSAIPRTLASSATSQRQPRAV